MDGGKQGDKQTRFPIFCGFFYGMLAKPPQLFVGGLRTFGQLGLQGPQQQQMIHYHDLLTARAVNAGFRYAVGLSVDQAIISTIWNVLPPEAHNNTIHWGKLQVGHFLGGSAISWVSGKGLVKYLPKKYVTPALFFLSCQGAMGLFWKDGWDKGPPPDPPDVRGGGTRLSV